MRVQKKRINRIKQTNIIHSSQIQDYNKKPTILYKATQNLNTRVHTQLKRYFTNQPNLQPITIPFNITIIVPQPHKNPMQTSKHTSKSLQQLIKKLHNKEYIQQQQIKSLCQKAKEILLEEKNLLQLPSPITVCGDIHGQFYDLLELFKIGGEPPYVSYLFLGDYVDRGLYSVETFLLLLTYKVRYKSKFFLIRGNHESRQITQVYGFYDECLRKYGSLNIWKYCTDIFDYLPLAAVIDDKILCVHGGLSPNIQNLDDIRSLDRKQQIPNIGAMCDLMWSDPDQIQGWLVSPRGAGYLFGQNTVQQFNRTNNINLICRAHQLVMQGYKKIFSKKLVTVWSAPNYCYRCGNVGSILEIDEHCTQYYKIFEASVQTPQTIRRVPQYFL